MRTDVASMKVKVGIDKALERMNAELSKLADDRASYMVDK